MTHLRGLATALTLLLLIPLPVACQQVDRFNDPYVINYTDVRVALFYVHNGQTTSLHVTTGNDGSVPLALFRDGCSDGTLLALDPSGRVVAQRDTPLCAGDYWVIGTPPSASP